MSNLQVEVNGSKTNAQSFEVHLVEEGLVGLGGKLPQSALSNAAGFTGLSGQTLVAYPEGSSTPILFVGLGSSPDCESFRLAGSLAVRSVSKDVVQISVPMGSVSPAKVASFTEGAVLGHYRFDLLRGEGFDRSSVAKLQKLEIVVDNLIEVSPEFENARIIANATCLARDLVNEHAATMTPSHFADIAESIAAKVSLECRIWDLEQIKKERLGGLLAVSKGSVQEPRLVKLSYRPPGSSSKSVVALVGKGITFDSGGLSLKSGDGMMTMKTDMSGAAAVLATMSVLPKLGVNVPVDGYMALSENMPSGSATKPGDVFVARNGKSIEVLNTDAEGRLVLADALSLAVEDGAKEIIDLATLTGACVVALGREIGGILGNNKALVDEVIEAGEMAGESHWQLPLPERYKKHIESEVADMKNIGAPGAAGTISAALLLQEFVGDAQWCHLDIAGPSRSDSDERYFRKGGTGFGVRTLCKFLSIRSKTSNR